MTIVAALVTPEGAWMGSDSLSSDDVTCAVVASPKIGKFGDKLIGFSGDWDGIRVLDIARRNPDLTAEELLFRVGPLKDGFALLIVERDELYFVQSEKTLIRRRKNHGRVYDAIGSGAPIALGALYRAHADRHDLTESVRAASFHNPHCGGHTKVVSL